MPRWLTVSLWIIGQCALLAGDSDPASQARAVWRAAQKGGDAWTCLQLEAWGRAQQPIIKLGPVLGPSVILGNPSLTFPSTIQAMRDVGDRIVVVAAQRAWVLAPDGRPLQPSLLLPRGEPTIASDGQFVLTIAAEGSPWRVVLTRIADGKPVLSTEIPVAEGQQRTPQRAIAHDGSAVAIGVTSPVPNGPPQERVLVFKPGEPKPLELAVRAQPLAIGPAGSWLIVGGGNEWTVTTREQPLLASSVASGQGIAVCLAEGNKLWRIAQDGSRSELAGVPPLGDQPRVFALGEWLVLATGQGAKTAREDLLGDTAQETVLPPRMALWRWHDLARDPTAQPVTTLVGRPAIDRSQPAALWLWNESRVELCDLSGENPATRPVIPDAGAHVLWVENDGPLIRVHARDQICAYYDWEGRELWRGPAHGLRAWRHNAAIVERREGDRFAYVLVRLASDPNARAEISLAALPPQRMGMRIPLFQPDLLVANNDQGRWWVLGFDGAIQHVRPPDQNFPPPPIVGMAPSWRHDAAAGRFFALGARLIPARLSAPAPALASGEDLIDAWRTEAGTWLLDRSGRLVLLPAREREQSMQLAGPPHALFLALGKDLAVQTPGQQLWRIERGPPWKLEAAPGPAEALPSGPWKVDRLSFGIPRGKHLQWDEERLGWKPVRLRSPAQSGLFVITPAVLLELREAEAARYFGR